MKMDSVVIRRQGGRGYTTTNFESTWDCADRIIVEAGLSVDPHDLVTPEFEWSNLETVIAVLRFNGISAEVAKETE